ncbi:hypothetical protein LSAT2_009575 [Lamellibrachia satsuma]|nr:hypothetical protein LSAT2_009575 [Lamellibrachia satsuma]
MQLGSITQCVDEVSSASEFQKVRKRGRTVSILIPHDIQYILELITDAHVRAKVCLSESPYVFANFSGGVFRAGDSLNKMDDAASMECPNFIKSTKLRQYIATTIQLMDLNTTQMDTHTHILPNHRVQNRVYIPLLNQDGDAEGEVEGDMEDDMYIDMGEEAAVGKEAAVTAGSSRDASSLYTKASIQIGTLLQRQQQAALYGQMRQQLHTTGCSDQ